MEIMKRVAFEFEEKKYDILVIREENGYRVRAFSNNKPVNPWVYSVDFETNMDFNISIGEPAYDHLIEMAKSDVTEKRLEKLFERTQKI